jgi:hypothetical protein
MFTGAAHAKTWKKLAPDPLASDSSYAALLAQPSDSLTASQLSWLAVQRDWRAQRKEETEPSPASITESRNVHHSRPGDKRFAALAAQPYAALPDTDRAWLVAENAAQRVVRENSSDGSGAMGLFVLLVVAAALAATATWGYVYSQSYGHF